MTLTMNGVYTVLAVMFLVLATQGAIATQHVVGGSQGWDESVDYGSWASGHTFKVGDQLVFKYTAGLHSLVELAGESQYKNCDIGSAVNSMNGGNDVVKLSKPGTRYFACGTLGHCDQGMKLKVKTVAGNATSSPESPSSSSASASSASAVQSSASFVLMVVVSITIGVLGNEPYGLPLRLS